ncbi:hypothetical protein FPANT_11381 [Fusarium pseudoanthophilum]|uniref:Uncharacterized protein n=1 Tax=Fusarium pseudoanthophilum TaxID=48495 RepID=A0A8H5NSI4_9HYPO|nr:hypothetical protein FPANT_11381 [Fusarium pseudoanthophilum]
MIFSKTPNPNKQVDKVCITRDADAILDDKDLTTDIETHYRDQDIPGYVAIPKSARARSYTKSAARKMILEFAVATDNARVLPECKSMSKPDLVSGSFNATIDNIFPCAGNVVSIEDSGGYGVDERWTSRILFDPKRDIMRISNNCVPRLKRHGEVGAPSRSPVRHLMLAPLHSLLGSAPRNIGGHPNPSIRRYFEEGLGLDDCLPYYASKADAKHQASVNKTALERRVANSDWMKKFREQKKKDGRDCPCAAYNVTALRRAASTSYGNKVGVLADTSALQIAQYEVVTINSHYRTAEQARVIHNFNDPEGKS